MSGELKLLKEQLAQERDKTDSKILQIGKLEQALLSCEDDLKLVNLKYGEALTELTKLREEIIGKNFKIVEKEQRYSEIQDDLEKVNTRLEKLKFVSEQDKVLIAELNVEAKGFHDKEEEFTKSNQELKSSFEKTSEELQNLKRELKEKSDLLKKEKEESSAFKTEMHDTYGGVDKLVKPYLDIGEKILACESTKDKMSKFLPLEKVENQMLFIRQVGRDKSFASEIYNAMRLVKSLTKEPLNDVERDLVVSINQFYRKNDHFDYDVMVIPDNGDKFNKAMHQDLEKASSYAFLSYSEVYVPALMNDEKSVAFKAIVKGKS